MCFALYAGCSRRYTHEKHIKKTLSSDSAGTDWLSLADTRQVKFKEQITSVYLLEGICSLNVTCRVSARLSQSLPALSEHNVFFVCFSCVYRLEHLEYNAKHMRKLWYFLMKNVTFRVLFTEGGTLWKRVPKRVKKVAP